MLFPCTDCGSPISSEAQACPHCGKPNAGTSALESAATETLHETKVVLRMENALGRPFSINATEWKPSKKPLFFSFIDHRCGKSKGGPLKALEFIGLKETFSGGTFYIFQTLCCKTRLEFNVSYLMVGMATMGDRFGAYISGDPSVEDPGFLDTE